MATLVLAVSPDVGVVSAPATRPSQPHPPSASTPPRGKPNHTLVFLPPTIAARSPYSDAPKRHPGGGTVRGSENFFRRALLRQRLAFPADERQRVVHVGGGDGGVAV